MRKYLITMLLVLYALYGFGQQKYEREVRIRERDVPENALEFIASMNFNTNIRWYKEFGESRISFEAKTRYNGQLYSIEFSEDGTFEDVEIEISPGDIPEVARIKMMEYLQSVYKVYAIEKVQIQYTGEPALIVANFRNSYAVEGIVTHFEFVISAKVDGSFRMFEYLFTDKGDFVHMYRIIEKSTDNIIY